MNIEDVQEEQSKEAGGQENDQKEGDDSEEEGEDDESHEDPAESDDPDGHSDLESDTESEEESETPKTEHRQTPGEKLSGGDQEAQKATGTELPYVFAGKQFFLFSVWDSVPGLVGFCCFLNNGHNVYLRVSLPGDGIVNA